jgi:exodeoxyribonuclease VII small subunit
VPPQGTFEQDIEKLKSLVASLESHSLDLDRAITSFEEGIKLSRTLSERLTQAEARLEEITRAADGALAATPAPPGGWGAAPVTRPAKGPAGPKPPSEPFPRGGGASRPSGPPSGDAPRGRSAAEEFLDFGDDEGDDEAFDGDGGDYGEDDYVDEEFPESGGPPGDSDEDDEDEDEEEEEDLDDYDDFEDEEEDEDDGRGGGGRGPGL